MNSRTLVTGALGCIGAWVVRSLVQDQLAVVALDASGDDHRFKLLLSPEERAQVQRLQGDITDLPALERVVQEHGITHVIHLAALQVPFCKNDPALGARVNVVGTVNVFEAARRAGIRQVTYASSIAVFGLSEEYPTNYWQRMRPAGRARCMGFTNRPMKARPRSTGWIMGSARSACGLMSFMAPGETRG